MKVVFISNYMNHHQLYVSEEFVKQLGNDNYIFVACAEFDRERLAVGYIDMNYEYEYIIRAYESRDEYKRAMHAIKSADVIIFGSGYESLFAYATRCKGIVFRYSERIYKTSYDKSKKITHKLNEWRLHSRFKRKNVNMLCASAYTAGDFAIGGNYIGRCYKWGYFPKSIKYDIEESITKRDSDNIKIIWVARFLEWKHPEIPVLLAEKLVAEGIDTFNITMLGTGSELEKTKELAKRIGVDKKIDFVGGVSTDKVREHMLASDIFLFTSDFNEGWGVVLNEAMNSGLACVASHAIGAVPFLIQDGENGLIYRNGDFEDCYIQIRKIIDDRDYLKQLGVNAYKTIIKEWNPQNAVAKFLQLVEDIKAGKHTIEEGVCSKAQALYNDWK